VMERGAHEKGLDLGCFISADMPREVMGDPDRFARYSSICSAIR